MARKTEAQKLATSQAAKQAAIEALLAEARALKQDAAKEARALKKLTEKEAVAKRAQLERDIGKAVLDLDASLTIDKVKAIVEAHLAAQPSAVPTLVDATPAFNA